MTGDCGATRNNAGIGDHAGTKHNPDNGDDIRNAAARFGGLAGDGHGRPPPSATPGWSTAAQAALVRLWDEGLTAPEVAARLGKTTRAVECKIHKLRAAGHRLAARRSGRGPCPARRARRRCLYCGGTFLSSHPGNRLCPVCLADGPFTSSLV